MQFQIFRIGLLTSFFSCKEGRRSVLGEGGQLVLVLYLSGDFSEDLLSSNGALLIGHLALSRITTARLALDIRPTKFSRLICEISVSRISTLRTRLGYSQQQYKT